MQVRQKHNHSGVKCLAPRSGPDWIWPRDSGKTGPVHLYATGAAMPRKILKPAQLDFQPRPTYPYSPGAMWGNLIFTAGQVAWGCDGNIVGEGNIEAQTRQTLANVAAVLAEGGATWDDVLKCNVYLKHMADFQRMNRIFSETFPDDPPARTTLQAPMAEASMLIEIEAFACIGG